MTPDEIHATTNWTEPHYVRIHRSIYTAVGYVVQGSVTKMPGGEARRLCFLAAPPAGELADDLVASLGRAMRSPFYISPEDMAEIDRDRAAWIARQLGEPIVVPDAEGEAAQAARGKRQNRMVRTEDVQTP